MGLRLEIGGTRRLVLVEAQSASDVKLMDPSQEANLVPSLEACSASGREPAGGHLRSLWPEEGNYWGSIRNIVGPEAGSLWAP